MKIRPEIDEYFLKIAKVVGERATCVRRKIGAVAVIDKHIIATGYNGAPTKMSDCLELGCLRDQNNIKSGSPHAVCRSVHAEQNVIIQAAIHGVSIKGATIYCTTAPCSLCARMLVNAGIKRYVCFLDYPDQEARQLFKNSKVKLEIHKEPSFATELIGEQVLAVPEDAFKEAGCFTGYKKKDEIFYDKILKKVRYINRDDAEKDESWKQIIPYVLVRSKEKYLLIQRLPRSGEKRLHNKFTLGVGGHINPGDSTSEAEGNDVIERGMMRELNEEVWIEGLKDIVHLGYIYDDSESVSRHHLGFVYLAKTNDENIKTLEPEKLKALLVNKNELSKYISKMEGWAKIAHENLIKNSV